MFLSEKCRYSETTFFRKESECFLNLNYSSTIIKFSIIINLDLPKNNITAIFVGVIRLIKMKYFI
ncbi:hypothetical protein FUAX_45990 (plasmid) [Fulvitalea axinellae]|uniref:Uncharacterized protein n=1 Tax=Fulvitalea axinellae TaxID=1182444 RepID=A0AAU9CYX6_9BACT|nr:hypothetical protein FUAX_45990 [Fulvitalea axinellae]